MHLIYALIVTIFLTTMTPPPPTPTPTAGPAIFIAPRASDAQLGETADILAARLDALGVDYREIEVVTANDTAALHVQLQPRDLTPRVIELLTQPGYLEFVEVSTLDPAETTDALIWTTGQATRLDTDPPEGTLLNPETERPFKTILDGTQITNAEVLVSPYDDASWIVEITLTDAAGETMREYSTAHIGDALGIVIDGRILSAPVISNAISSPLWISGNFTETEARELAAQLDGGPLPVPLEFTGFVMLAQ